jgi:hypothetical protein
MAETRRHKDLDPCPVCNGSGSNLALVPELPELPPLPIGALAVGVVNLLQEAASLPPPRSITVCDTQEITVQFAEDPDSLRAIARWALRFGGVLVSEPHHDENGRWTYCHTEFSYFGVAVTACAFLPASPAPRHRQTEDAGCICGDPGCIKDG